ncbi:PAS domain S-box protein [Belnapia rosea]|uniref:PAS domain S-box protein n=1 Tax=Belnapia rosea TaxID=938405 RepID=UPI00088A7326|nr:PAS domain S-box protein [Belnapia rosea]SDB66072.1 PAS domain S-box-containing protein [Belnapia rosea]
MAQPDGSGSCAVRTLFQALGDCTYALDREFRFLAYDEAAATYFGRPAEAVLGRTIWETFPKTSIGRLEPVLRQVMEERRPLRAEMAGAVRPDRWIEYTIYPTPEGIGIAFSDRTEARRAAEALQANEERLRDLLATLDLGTSMARDLDGIIRFWSEGCGRLYGWAAAEALGQSAHRLLQTQFPVPPSAIEAMLEATGEWTGDLRQVARDGRALIVEARKVLRRDATGRPVAVLEALSDVTAQRAAEAALAESEARLALATAAAEIGIWDWTFASDRLVCSTHVTHICGLDPAQPMTPAAARRVVDRADLTRVLAALRRARDPKSRQRIALECCIRRPDGELRHVALQAEPVFAGAKATRIVGTLRDVTERWQMQEERFASAARLRLAVEAGRMAVWDVDMVEDRLTGSPELPRLLGFSATEVPDLAKARTRFAPGERERLGSLIAAALARGEHFVETEFRYLWPDGSARWLMLRTELSLGASGRPVRATGVLLDITERRRMEEALRESEARLRLAVAAAGLTSWEVDPLQRVARRSDPLHPASATLSDFSLEAYLASIHPEDRARVRSRLDALSTGSIEDYAIEYRVQVPERDGWCWIESHGTIAERDTQTGLPSRLAGVARDITERKQAEERQSLLAREVDHRAKNALAVVQAALRLTPKEDPVAYVQAVEGRVAALARAQTLLARGRWTGAELRTLLEDELAPFLVDGAQAPRVRLEGPPVLLWPAATQALSMAVHELATNAVKHGALSQPGGLVTVRWRVEIMGSLHLRLEWTERGGPPVAGSPGRRGFGSRVLEATVRAQLGGQVRQNWAAEGVQVQIDIPLLGGGIAPVPPDVAATLQ